MLKKLLIIIFICCYLVVPFGVSATSTSTELQTERQTENITQIVELNTEDSNNNTPHMTFYCFGFLAGCLLAQAFSFWKW